MINRKLSIGDALTLDIGSGTSDAGSITITGQGNCGTATKPIYISNGEILEGSDKYVFYEVHGSSVQLQNKDGTNLYPVLSNDVNINNNLYVGGTITGMIDTYSTTIPYAGWSSSAPYTQTILVPDITSDHNPIVSVKITTNDSMTADAQKEAFACIDKGETTDGRITFTCLLDKPEVDIPIIIKIC